MKTYQKVLMGVGAATVACGVGIIAAKYYEVKKEEEAEMNSPKGRLLAKTEEVKNMLKGQCNKETCDCPKEVFKRRMRKVFNLEA